MVVRQEVPGSAVALEFEEFYREERPALLRLAHLLTGSASIGEELVQEALVAVHGRWDQLENPAGYSRRALVNLSHSYHRRRALERRHRATERVHHSLPPEIDEMWTAIRTLPERHRAVLVLRFYADLPLDEIADLLDRPIGTVKSWLHRGLARLKETMS